MKKVGFLIGNLNKSGGTERVTTLIVNELARQHYEVCVLNLNDGSEPFFDLHDTVRTYSLYSKSISFKKNYIGAIWKIRKFVKRQNIDTLIIVDSISCLFTVPALYGLKVNHICWEHFNFKNNNGVKLREIGRQWAAKYCDYIVTLTKRDKELWEQGLKLKNINAQIVPIANPSPYENNKHVPSLDFKVLLSVGRLTHVKGFDILLDAWAQVCESNSDWQLRIVGGGEEEANLKEQVSRLGISERVDFVPATKNIEHYYKTSSFYCLSSRFEGLPMVLLEAQAFGLPIIAFDCDTGPSEIVDHDVNGWLVPSQDIESLRDTILQSISISNDNYASLVKNSHLKSSMFMIDKIVLRWKKII